MPRLANLRTDYEYGQLPYNHAANGQRRVINCEFPPYPKKVNKTWQRNAIWGIIGTGLFLIVCLICVAIAFTVLFAIKSPNDSGYTSGSPGYALYKNTRFEKCYRAPAITSNCTAIRSALTHTNNTSFGSLGSNKVFNKDGGEPFAGWCEAMGCFHSYKVIPSTPRASAIWPTPLTSWAASAGFLAASLFQLLLQQKALYSPENKSCKALGDLYWYSWLFIAYDFISFVWWWLSFGKLATAPKSAATPFIVGWVIPWKYAGLFRYHPFSCAFRKTQIRKNVTRCIFYILAVMQWIASLYVAHINFPIAIYTKWGLRAPNPSYDCIQSQIDAAPGISTCSASKICSRNEMFVDNGYQPAYHHANAIFILGTFGLLTIAALWPVCMVVASFLMDGGLESSLRSMLRKSDGGPITSLAILSIFGIAYGCELVEDIVRKLGATPDAAVKFDWECRAIHVALSDWRYYLDVHYEQGWRIAKMWFNS